MSILAWPFILIGLYRCSSCDIIEEENNWRFSLKFVNIAQNLS